MNLFALFFKHKVFKFFFSIWLRYSMGKIYDYIRQRGVKFKCVCGVYSDVVIMICVLYSYDNNLGVVNQHRNSVS